MRPRRLVGAHGDFAVVAHSAGAPDSFACQVPAAGVLTSANQKYGGPPRALTRFSRDPAVGRDQQQLALERLFGGDR